MKVLIMAHGDTVPHILGCGSSETLGVRQGYIEHPEETAKSVRDAVAIAAKAAGFAPRRAVVGVGGIGLSSITAYGSIAVSRADSEITALDAEKAEEASHIAIPSSVLQNKRVIYQIVLQYKIDGKMVPASPVGLKGAKLEAKTFFVLCMGQHIDNLLEAVETADIAVESTTPSPLAASTATLSRAQKAAGVVLANIGSETVSIVVFENNMPISLEVFPVGGGNITNDIALGLRIPLEEAESVKRGAITGTTFPKKKLDEIIAARLTDIFELIEAHLKKMGRSGLLPAGVVLTGGGSSLATIDDLAKAALRLPARIANSLAGENGKSQIKDASWSVAYGLASMGLLETGQSLSFGLESARRAKNTVSEWFKQFLP
ncbi:MAG: Cell division protein ftsA [Parcubacteria group bacterium GW2011_GWA2_47_12]|nr:MAG: Cell division protein ftsA [Parcubacteria group bacterium GW2011_GWA2_47_12]